MPRCTGGNWWVCVEHIYNNCRFENCSIYDDNVSYLTYKGNLEKISTPYRTKWIRFLINNLKINDFELIDNIGLEKKEIVIKKLNKQLEYLEPKKNTYFSNV